MTDIETLHAAADLLAEEARVMRECHTIGGRWDEGDEDVRRVAEKMGGLARDLRRIATTLPGGN